LVDWAKHLPETTDFTVIAVLGLYVTKMLAKFLDGIFYRDPAFWLIAGLCNDIALICIYIKTGFKNFGLVSGNSEIVCLGTFEDLPAVMIEFHILKLLFSSLI